jgi:hypothetical protein
MAKVLPAAFAVNQVKQPIQFPPINQSAQVKALFAPRFSPSDLSRFRPSIELNRFAVGKNELPLDPDDLGFSS